MDLEPTAAGLLAALQRDTRLDSLKYAANPRPVGGGFWAEILTFSLNGAPPQLEGDLVAKITPSRLHGEREASVQAAVADQRYPAPPVLLRGVGPNEPDGFYFVMPKVEGAPPLAAASAAALVRSVPSLALKLPGLLADLAVRLHGLNPIPLRAAMQSHPGWAVDVDDLVGDMAAAADQLDNAQLATAIRTLLARRPRSESSEVICHGDFHPLNVIVGPGAATVVDWTAARNGPPAFDVAFTALLLAHPPIGVGPAFARPLNVAGQWLAKRFVSGYRRRARAGGWDLPPQELSWYSQLHAARILIDVSERGDAGDHPYKMLTGPATMILGNGEAMAHHGPLCL